MTVWETVLVFGVAPLAGLTLLAALTFAPGASRTPRYRVGKPWDFEPVWYVARPDVDAPAGSAAGRAAIAAASGRTELRGRRPVRWPGVRAGRPHGHGEGWGQWRVVSCAPAR